MKNLMTYINENKRFQLSEYEGDALSEVLGHLIGYLGKYEDYEKFDKFRKITSEGKLDIYKELFDFIDDTRNKLNQNTISKEERQLLIKLIDWMDENDIISDYDDYELCNVHDKLSNSL